MSGRDRAGARPTRPGTLLRALDIDLIRAWRHPPTVATLNTVAWVTSILYGIGGIVVMAAAALFGQALAVTISDETGLMAVAISLSILAFRHLLPRWFYFIAVLWGTCLITRLILVSHGGAAPVAVSLLYLFVVVDAAFFFSIRDGLLQYGLMLAAALIAFRHQFVPVGAAVMLVVCSMAIMGVVMWLVRKIDDVEEDSLTGLLNRRGIDRQLEQAMRHAKLESCPLHAAIIDLDKFKLINDVQGHLKGDRLLADCANAWRASLPGGHHLGRYGGDEFVLLLLDQAQVDGIAECLRKSTPAGVTASIGVAKWIQGESASMFLSRADTALYQAKLAGRDRIVFYEDTSHDKHDIEAAIDGDELRVHYQPIVNLMTQEAVIYEALLRWQHAGSGLRMPGEFIMQAERSGAIHALGAWLMQAVIADLANGFAGSAAVSINVSAHELRRADYAESLLSLLARHRLDGKRLVVEVTESAFGDNDPQILRTLQRLREQGVQVAIDDFGAGYSSLWRIQRLPIDIIKLDGAMVQSIIQSDKGMPILEALVTMGRGLGVLMVAEWVENEKQAGALRELGYQYAQGFLFGRPEPRALNAPSAMGQVAESAALS